MDKNTFVASLIASIMIALIISYGIIAVKPGAQGATGEQGIQGETGLQGEQGLQGIQGEQGEVGPRGETGIPGIQGPQGWPGADGKDCNCEADISASLDFYYTNVIFGTDYHDVKGFMINFGAEYAWDVEITIQWHLYSGGYHEETNYIGFLSGHEIFDYSHRFYFEGGYDYITYEITWD